LSADESRAAVATVRIGYQGVDPLGNVLVEPQVFVEQNGERIVLSRGMIDLIAYHQRRASEATVEFPSGEITLPPGFHEGKRAAMNAKERVDFEALNRRPEPLPIDEDLAP
jgi:hypothetical protein